MPNVFSARSDLLLRASLAAGALLVLGGGAAWVLAARPSYSPYVGYAEPQPVMFSHEHHTGRLGLDCRYCHEHAEESDFAGMPPASTCMNCHLQLYTTAPMLQPVRDAWATDRPVEWRRVYRLPDFVRFSHKPHVSAGVACVSCHGRMDEQPLTRLEQPLTMGWCLDCHREPAGRLVGAGSEFSPRAQPGITDAVQPLPPPRALPATLTNCSTCHY